MLPIFAWLWFYIFFFTIFRSTFRLAFIKITFLSVITAVLAINPALGGWGRLCVYRWLGDQPKSIWTVCFTRRSEKRKRIQSPSSDIEDYPKENDSSTYVEPSIGSRVAWSCDFFFLFFICLASRFLFYFCYSCSPSLSTLLKKISTPFVKLNLTKVHEYCGYILSSSEYRLWVSGFMHCLICFCDWWKISHSEHHELCFKKVN